jgi:hypothetical protein
VQDVYKHNYPSLTNGKTKIKISLKPHSWLSSSQHLHQVCYVQALLQALYIGALIFTAMHSQFYHPHFISNGTPTKRR